MIRLIKVIEFKDRASEINSKPVICFLLLFVFETVVFMFGLLHVLYDVSNRDSLFVSQSVYLRRQQLNELANAILPK